MKLTTQHHWVSRLRMHGFICPLSICLCRVVLNWPQWHLYLLLQVFFQLGSPRPPVSMNELFFFFLIFKTIRRSKLLFLIVEWFRTIWKDNSSKSCETSENQRRLFQGCVVRWYMATGACWQDTEQGWWNRDKTGGRRFCGGIILCLCFFCISCVDGLRYKLGMHF